MKKKYYFYSIMTCLEKAIQYPVECGAEYDESHS